MSINTMRSLSIASAGLGIVLLGCFRPAGDGSSDSVTAPETTPQARASELQALDLESLPTGTIVDQLFGTLGDGPVLVNGISPLLAGNTAIIFDSANPTGGDWDLGSPNETCGGPGQGAGGEVGSPYENCDPLGKVLIIAADLEDAGGDGLVDDPDDIDVAALDGVIIELDFSALGTVTMHSLNVLDIDGNGPDPRVEMYGVGGVLLSTVPIPNDMENNGAATVDLGDVSGVVDVTVYLQGSGAIDTFFFRCDTPPGGGEGCTPGYWGRRHHFCHWPAPYETDTAFSDVFGRDVPDVTTLLDGLHSQGSYKNLVFHAVAALLNAASDEVDFDYDVADVIAIFQDGWDSGDLEGAKNLLAGANESDCPLGNCR